MKGRRPLNNDEIRRVCAAFTGTLFEVRNRGLFMLGVSTSGTLAPQGDLQFDVMVNFCN